jgi:transcription elongation factor Elf1
VTHVSHTATFDPDDPLALILEDLACPVCGRQDLGEPHARITGNRMCMFCEGCGALVTTQLTDAQVKTIYQRVTASAANES